MSVLSKAVAMLAGASPQELQEMSPVERRKVADTLRHWLTLAEMPKAQPKAGVLSDLKQQRAEWR